MAASPAAISVAIAAGTRLATSCARYDLASFDRVHAYGDSREDRADAGTGAGALVARRSRRLSVTVTTGARLHRRRWSNASTACCRRPNAGSAAMPAAGPMPNAMARGEAGIDHCPPGGDAGARALARVLGVPAKPYDRSRGEQAAAAASRWWWKPTASAAPSASRPARSTPSSARRKLMHVVIDPLCTGCELCVPGVPGRLHRDGTTAKTRQDLRWRSERQEMFASECILRRPSSAHTKNPGRKTSL
jgi:electron transport complex protein RnfB